MDVMQVMQLWATVVVIIAVLVAIVMIVRTVLDHREREAIRRDAVLREPLETFGDLDAQRLADKYRDPSEAPTARSASRSAATPAEDFDFSSTRRSAPFINISINTSMDGKSAKSDSRRSRRAAARASDDPGIYIPGQTPPRSTSTSMARRSAAIQGSGDNQSSKDRMSALLLCLFLGNFGAHYFYCDRPGMGVLYLMTAGVFGIGWAVDAVRLALGLFTDSEGRYLY